jgi:hypothetical protein
MLYSVADSRNFHFCSILKSDPANLFAFDTRSDHCADLFFHDTFFHYQMPPVRRKGILACRAWKGKMRLV